MIHLVCCIDEKYIQHCGVMLISLFENNPNHNFAVHIISNDMTNDDKCILSDIIKKYENNVFFYYIDGKWVESLPLFEGDHISLATYYRLFLPIILPDAIDKVLYLDCDLIVVSDIIGLWNTDLKNKPLAAIAESTAYLSDDNFVRLMYDNKYLYFNAGVLLINLDYWRKNNCVAMCMQYLEKCRSRIRWHDQDILNGVFHDCWVQLPVRYNALQGYYQAYFFDSVNVDSAIKENVLNELKSAVIVHFCAKNKPWDFYNQHPLRFCIMNI